MSLKVIANNLGLSITTVSRALGGHSDVSEPTRIRIEREAQRIGYVPNEMARRLQKGRADAIGLVVAGTAQAFDEPHVVEVMAGLWSRLETHDLDLLVMSAVPGPAELRLYRRLVEGRRVDGLIVTRARPDDARLAYLAETAFPHVVVGAAPASVDRHLVALDVDRRHAAEIICSRLAGFGHHRIASVGFDSTISDAKRRQAIRDIALRFGMSAVDVAISGEPGECEGLAQRLSQDLSDVTAIVAVSDRIAPEIARAVRDQGRRPGEDLSIISFGDCQENVMADPPITAVYLPTRDMSAHAVDILLRLRDGLPAGEPPNWVGQLVVRRSDGPVPARAALSA